MEKFSSGCVSDVSGQLGNPVQQADWNGNLEMDEEASPMAKCDKLYMNVMDIQRRQGLGQFP